MADDAGYELHIVIFIRSQLDYINSRYVTTTAVYHHQTFEQFVGDALKEGSRTKKSCEEKSKGDRMCLIFGAISSLY